MTTVLAALDTTATARPVLETALGIGRLMGAAVEVVHVGDGSSETPEKLAERSGLPFRLLHGPVEPALLDALGPDDVVAAVLGSRSRADDQRPVGHTALRVLERALKPVVVVSPTTLDGSSRPLRRLLLPLEGKDTSSRPVVERLLPLIADDVELVVLHVFTSATTPRFLDRPGRDLELLSEEFLTRHCPTATRIELRTGAVGEQVAEVCAGEGADLVVLSWAQTMEAGRAATVRDVLVHARIPVLLLPVEPVSGPPGPSPLDLADAPVV